MAKAKASLSVDPWSREGLPLDVVCQQNAPALWDAYVRARDAACDLDEFHGFVPLSLKPDEERRLSACKSARDALTAWLRGYLQQHPELELWACPGSRIAEPKRVPRSAIGSLEFDFERGTITGEGLPLLYDGCLRQAGAPAVVSPAGVPTTERKPAGAKAGYYWDALHAESLRRIDDNGLPDNVAQFTRDLLEWCALQFGEAHTPDFETARKYVARWIKGWDRSLPRK
jgi:hypothetical protein